MLRRVIMIHPQNLAALCHQMVKLKKLYMNALIHGSGGIVSVYGISNSYRKMCEQDHITYIPEGKAQEVQPDMPKRPLKYGRYS
ncbi:tRNA-dihydrouridine(47) synthase [Trichinella spiralis]|uniref:tRNA-dihydrouridine(47) synthase n=1 Tax=Trichinella spiralis TaxID=6334 RepID=A0ABR3K737_TRISP